MKDHYFVDIFGSQVRRLMEGLLDVIYPPRCAGCEAGISATEQPLCARCIASLERVDPSELHSDLTRSGCENLASSFALWMFDKGGILQQTQHLLKYGRRPAFGRVLGRVLGKEWQSADQGELPDLVVPVPLHRVRYYERGYNQSAMLSLGVGEVLRVPVHLDIVTRTSATKRQTGLSRDERSANVQGAFSVRDGWLTGRSVLLVDDVVTTGATAHEVAEAILQAGALRVDFAALAYARH